MSRLVKKDNQMVLAIRQNAQPFKPLPMSIKDVKSVYCKQ